MSSANAVPETRDLTGSDVKETLRHTGSMRLLRDAFERLRASDGSAMLVRWPSRRR